MGKQDQAARGAMGAARGLARVWLLVCLLMLFAMHSEASASTDGGHAEEGAQPAEVQKEATKISQAMRRIKAKSASPPKPPAPSRKQVMLKAQMKRVKEKSRYKRERQSAVAKQQQHKVIKAGGKAVQAHLAKLKTMWKKRVTSRHAMLGMANEGELLVRAYLRHGKRSTVQRAPSHATVPASRPSSTKASAAKDAAKVAKYRARQLTAAAKAAKAQARKNDKFQMVMREKRRIARQKYAQAKKRAAQAKVKALGAKAKAKLVGKRAVAIAAGKAKIA